MRPAASQAQVPPLSQALDIFFVDASGPVDGDQSCPPFHHGLKGSRDFGGEDNLRSGTRIEDDGISSFEQFRICRPPVGNDGLDSPCLAQALRQQLTGRKVFMAFGRVIRLVPEEEDGFSFPRKSRCCPQGKEKGEVSGNFHGIALP